MISKKKPFPSSLRPVTSCERVMYTLIVSTCFYCFVCLMFCRQTPVLMIPFLSFYNNMNIVIVSPIQHTKVKSFALHRK